MNYFFDMDGVLVKYRRQYYKGPNPMFMQKGSQLFRKMYPDKKMIETAKLINENPRHTLYILTSIPETHLYHEHYEDKKHWISNHMGFIKEDQFLVCKSSDKKPDIAEKILSRKLSRFDILIDDFNKNLNEWENANGTGVKYLNGINSPGSYNGPTVNKTQSVKEIYDILSNFRPDLIVRPFDNI